MFTRLLLFVCCFRYCVLCVCIGGGGSTVSTVDVVCFVSDVGFAVIVIVFVVAVVFIYIFLILLLLLMLLWCLVIAGVHSAAVADALCCWTFVCSFRCCCCFCCRRSCLCRCCCFWVIPCCSCRVMFVHSFVCLFFYLNSLCLQTSSVF